MTNQLAIIASYIPPTLLDDILEDPQPSTQPKQTQFQAAVLFADVSGFTALTEALAKKGEEGPEEMTLLLNRYFTRIITVLESYGGAVVKFSGDAITVLFPASGSVSLADVTTWAQSAGTAVQSAMTEFATMQTSVGEVRLGLKVGIGAGRVMAMRVGGQFGRWEYVIAGDPLRQVAEAEGQATSGDVVLSPEARALVTQEARAPQAITYPDWQLLGQNEQLIASLRSFTPGAVRQWMDEGLTDWVGVLRPMAVMFMQVAGIDYEATHTLNQLHTFVEAAQSNIYRYEGSINKLAVDDKGTIFLALMGLPPFAHEDDPLRAVRCALDLVNVAEDQGITLSIGITTGRVFAGPVGSPNRREYTVMGDAVNLGARLMVEAKKAGGGIRCDLATFQAVRDQLEFEALPPRRLKGKSGLIRLYEPTGETAVATAKDNIPLIGRRAERRLFRQLLRDMRQGKSHVLIVEGEAGIGKSRLVEEFMAINHSSGLTHLLGTAYSIEQHTPYRAWRDILSQYFRIEELTDPAQREARIRQVVAEFLPTQLPRLPLLNDILPVNFSDSELTATLEPELRAQNVVILVLALLQMWAEKRPLLLVLEDAHWLDPMSWELTQQVARGLTVHRRDFMLVLAMRPIEEASKAHEVVQEIHTLSGFVSMNLGNMEPDEIVRLIARRLTLDNDVLPETLVNLINTRSSGNPFFAQELVYNLLERGVIVLEEQGNGRLQCQISSDLTRIGLSMPNTIQGLILARIDRLAPDKQLALKVAAVIGRTFRFTILAHTVKQQTEAVAKALENHLEFLASRELTALDVPEPDLVYIFKHIITQEVAYDTLLFTQRRQLHRTVAEWYETEFDNPETLAPYYGLLAHHYHYAEDEGKELVYSMLAGKEAAKRYANETAVQFFSRALELTPQMNETRYELLLQREQVYELIGARHNQKADLDDLLGVARYLEVDESRPLLRLAQYFINSSEYDEAETAVRAILARQPDDTMQTESYTLLGRIAWQQSDYSQAETHLQQALTLAKKSEDVPLQAEAQLNLGATYWYQGQQAKATEQYLQAIVLYRQMGEQRKVAGCLSSLGAISGEMGDSSSAIHYAKQALAICQTIGYRRGLSIIQTNLGAEYYDLGDYEAASTILQEAINISREIDNRWCEAVSLDTLGLVYHNQGAYDQAERLFNQSLHIHQERNDARNECFVLTHLGNTFIAKDQLDQAESLHKKAMQTRLEMQEEAFSIDNQASLAQIAFLQNNLVEAEASIEQVMTWMQENDANAVEYPLKVYLTCYEVLASLPSRRSLAIYPLQSAYKLLQTRAEAIPDEQFRQTFLLIPLHKMIAEAWAQRALLGEPDRLPPHGR